MRKNRYRCKRYRLYLPKSIGEALDTNLEYVARLIGPAVVIVPKGLENFFSRRDNDSPQTVRGDRLHKSMLFRLKCVSDGPSILALCPLSLGAASAY
jgi:hypothetical protein